MWSAKYELTVGKSLAYFQDLSLSWFVNFTIELRVNAELALLPVSTEPIVDTLMFAKTAANFSVTS